jgi:hypothetical protein
MCNQLSPSHEFKSRFGENDIGASSRGVPVSRRLQALRRAGSELAIMSGSTDVHVVRTACSLLESAIPERRACYPAQV